jgi:nucleoside-diphosphate-sugar epimerase
MRIAVTGASGFCGAAVAQAAAAAGAEIVCLGRRPGPVGQHRYWDAATDRPDLSGVDVVIHLAAAVGDPAPRQEAWFRAVNVDGTRRLLAAALGRPLVWVSSASVYDPRPGTGRVTEEHPTGWHRNAYGRTKATGERLALAAGAVVLRPRAVYGPGDPHLLPRLTRLVRGGAVWLPGPDVPLSLTHVENLAAACLAAISWPPGAYNIADSTPYWRDAALQQVFGVTRVVHLPAAAVFAAAALVEAAARPLPVTPRLTRYAVDQLTRPFVLDLGRATARGYRPLRSLADFRTGG